MMVTGHPNATYFVTDSYVIEVKDHVFEDRDECKDPRIGINYLDNQDNVVVGVELPAGVHFDWEERDELRPLLGGSQ